MTAPLFNAEVAYKRKAISEKLGGLSDRALDVLLKDVPRIALSKRTILYAGADLNRLVASAEQNGTSKAAPSGACARSGPAQ